MSEVLTTIAVLGLAFSLDLLIGEPPNRLHPVAWFGRLVGTLDREWVGTDRGQRLVGIGIALLVPLVPAIGAGGLVLVASQRSAFGGAALAGLVLFLTISLRSLLELTETVVAATAAGDGADADLETARERVRGLVGRETSTLEPAEIRSAAIESAAENLADGLVASLVPFAVLAPISLPAAAAVAAWVKGVNTLDSMLGYPSKPHGTASAVLDDLVMWIPARLTAVAIAIGGGNPRALRRAAEWADEPPSPNSGWPMATLACVLSIRLTKPGVYDLNAGAELPTVADGTRAIIVVGLAAVAAVILAVLLAVSATTLESAIVNESDGTVAVAVSTAIGSRADEGSENRQPRTEEVIS